MAPRDPRLIGVALIGVGVVALLVARLETTPRSNDASAPPGGRILRGHATDAGWVNVIEGEGGDWGIGPVVAVLGERPPPESIVRLGPSIVSSGNAAPETVAELGRHKPTWAQYCYESDLLLHPALQGKVVVQFVVGETGAVTDANVEQDTLGSAAVADCLTRWVRRWTVAARPTAPITVTVPFEFRPAP
jgi:TonB family protein